MSAMQVDTKYVIEAANGPTTPEGDKVLRERGITVLPDIYTNGGGVTVSFFEWVQVRRTQDAAICQLPGHPRLLLVCLLMTIIASKGAQLHNSPEVVKV